MLSDEWLTEHVDRINDIVKTADQMGDAGPVLGTVLLLSLTDEDYDTFTGAGKNQDFDAFAEVVTRAQDRLQGLGVARSED